MLDQPGFVVIHGIQSLKFKQGNPWYAANQSNLRLNVDDKRCAEYRYKRARIAFVQFNGLARYSLSRAS